MRRFRLQKGARFGYRAAGFTLIPLLSFLILMAIYQYTIPNRTAPLARQGVLDLSEWNFGKNGFINLNGQWEFYSNQLLIPDDFRSGAAARMKAVYTNIPNYWFGYSPVDQASQAKYGTYRLVVKLPESGGNYGFRVSNVRMAHRLYVNGVLLGNGGNPTPDVSSYKAGNTPYTTFTHLQGREMEVVLQVANFTLSTGGGFKDLQFGLQADMLRMDRIFFACDFLGCSSCFYLVGTTSTFTYCA